MTMTMRTALVMALIGKACAFKHSHLPPRSGQPAWRRGGPQRTAVTASFVEATLTKPMGLVFEDNAGGGLYVAKLADDGAAAASEIAIMPGDQLVAVADARATGTEAGSTLLGPPPPPPEMAITCSTLTPQASILTRRWGFSLRRSRR